MEGLIRRFWLGQRGDETKMSWVGWKSLCMSKIRGGMGFQDLHAFNLISTFGEIGLEAGTQPTFHGL